MKRIQWLLMVLTAFPVFAESPMVARYYQIASPRASMVLRLPVGSFSLSYEGTPLLQGSQIALRLSDGSRLTLGGRIVHTSHEENILDENGVLSPGLEFMAEGYNVFRMEYANGYGIEWRVADSGMAYRWYAVTGKATAFPIEEEAEFPFSSDKIDYLYPTRKKNNPYLTNRKKRHYRKRMSEKNDNRFCLPVFVNCGSVVVAINESDLNEYPKMALMENEPYSLKAVFPSASVGRFWLAAKDCDEGLCSPWRVVSLYTGKVRFCQNRF